MPEPAILCATNNPAKLKRLRWLVEGSRFQVLTPDDLGLHLAIDELGDSHQAIAELKATTWAEAAAVPALANDGGATIPALGARWDSLLTKEVAGPRATDEDRIAALLRLMAPYHGDERRIFWTDAVAIAHQGRVLWSTEVSGEEGRIVERWDARHLEPGFWVRALWYYPDLGKTHAQLTPSEQQEREQTWQALRREVGAFLAGYRAGREAER